MKAIYSRASTSIIIIQIIMNPIANEWKPSVAAAAWVPGQGMVSSSQPPAPAPAPPPPEPEAEAASEENDQIDESDPLWQAVLKIANGDRSRAQKMLNDPDQLTAYPEIEQLLLASAGDDDEAGDEMVIDDEANTQQQQQSDDGLETQVEKLSISNDDAKPAAAVASPTKGGDTTMDEAPTAPVVEAKEGDPREHFNLVFIGHVDAGKSTLCGNILYLTNNIDERTINRYKREATERYCDSWYLSFIMDTNDEERDKR